jgi:small subunit ribosomal protein S30e
MIFIHPQHVSINVFWLLRIRKASRRIIPWSKSKQELQTTTRFPDSRFSTEIPSLLIWKSESPDDHVHVHVHIIAVDSKMWMKAWELCMTIISNREQIWWSSFEWNVRVVSKFEENIEGRIERFGRSGQFTLIRMGRHHGSLAQAGKVRMNTPKVAKTEVKTKPICGRVRLRKLYNKRVLGTDSNARRRVGPNSHVQ